MPADFDMSQHGPRKLRVTTFCGMVFGTLSPDAPDFEAWLGPEIIERVRRVLGNRRLEIIGRFTQALPNNWKLYFENVHDTYHASLLHLFFATFRITRLSSGGGVLVSETGEHHASDHAPADAGHGHQLPRHALRKRRTSAWPIQACSACTTSSTTTSSCRSCRSSRASSCSRCITRWRCARSCRAASIQPISTGPTSASPTTPPELRTHRLKQNNLVGPAGYVSMEDGAVGGFVQRGIAAAHNELSVVEMGGSGAETQETRATEASVRGFWKAYRVHMGL